MDQRNKKRFREYGLTVGILAPGNQNTIADVDGVCVGHLTRIEGSTIRTGITVIDPRVEKLFEQKLPAAIAVGNGFGKLTGSTQVEELGTLEAPIALTNTLAVGPVMRGVIDVVIREAKSLSRSESVNVVVGETNDGFLNDIHRNSLSSDDVQSAYKACSKDFLLGSVGAGTGTRLFSWKGGVGTSSRIVRIGKEEYIVGVLVQTNYGGSLAIRGVPIGELLGTTDFKKNIPFPNDGSCMIILATNAPLTSRQLKRIASRTFAALARTGSVLSHASGDYAVAFSTNRSGIEGLGNVGLCVPDRDITPFFLAAVEATEESIYDVLFLAETMTGRDGNALYAFPVEEALRFLKK